MKVLVGKFDGENCGIGGDKYEMTDCCEASSERLGFIKCG